MLGRSAAADFAINLNSTTLQISRKHADFDFNPQTGRWTVRDLGSLNGVFVNGVRISARDFGSGDTVAIGSPDAERSDFF
ncbi:FHA domain-containing protein, partial [Salmonella sp. 6084]|uniref:FHA domain-containing protein n=1 Tax=Salmonella sp. 6084 TaxID=3159576 RepID=UPI00397D5FB2